MKSLSLVEQEEDRMVFHVENVVEENTNKSLFLLGRRFIPISILPRNRFQVLLMGSRGRSITIHWYFEVHIMYGALPSTS